MSSLSGTPIKAKAMRIIKLDECGVPVSGAGSAVIVTKGFISVAMAHQYQDGTEYIQQDITGDLCVNEMDDPAYKRSDLTITWCQICPDVISVATGEDLLTTGSATGTGNAFGEGLITARYSMELWTPMAGAGACDESGNQKFFYWAWPHIGGTKVGDSTFEMAPYQYTFTSSTKARSPLWQQRVGASAWLDSNVIGTKRHYLYNITTTPPPAIPENCGAVAL